MEEVSVIDILKILYSKLNKKRKREISFLFSIVILSVFSETLSLASAFPFLQIIIDQKSIWENYFVKRFLIFFGFNFGDNLIFLFCLFFGLSALFAAFVKSYYLWLSGMVAARISSDLSYACLKQNLYQSYDAYIDNKSSDLITNNAVYINQASEIISSVARLFSNLLMGISISLYLIILNPFLACISIFIFLIVYILLGKILQKQLLKNSKIIDRNSRYQVQLMQEAIGSFRDILLNANQNFFLNIFKKVDMKVRTKTAINVFYNLFPRYAIEGLFLVILPILVFLISFNKSDVVDLIAILGTFAIGAQKLLPCMQQSYGTWSYIVGSRSSLLSIINLSEDKYEKEYFSYSPKPLEFKNSIKLKDISFKYPGTDKYIFKDLNLEIFKGQKVGIIGKTGSGKSTMIDIIMGLLEPNSGYLLLDGVNILDPKFPYRKLDFRKSVAHVPQNIFLNNATIAENIAFGENLEEIDMERVRIASEEAKIYEYISKQRLNFYSKVGENGVKISGGQKQRIGLARAFYKKLEIMVLDEATSALDINTERKIMNSLIDLNPNITVIIITHRKNSIKDCDRVIEIKENKIIYR